MLYLGNMQVLRFAKHMYSSKYTITVAVYAFSIYRTFVMFIYIHIQTYIHI